MVLKVNDGLAPVRFLIQVGHWMASDSKSRHPDGILGVSRR